MFPRKVHLFGFYPESVSIRIRIDALPINTCPKSLKSAVSLESESPGNSGHTPAVQQSQTPDGKEGCNHYTNVSGIRITITVIGGELIEIAAFVSYAAKFVLVDRNEHVCMYNFSLKNL